MVRLSSFAVALALLVLVNGQQNCELIVCPSDTNMYFPHPIKCAAFCQCANGILSEQSCAEGQVFNPMLSICDWPENYECSIEDKDCSSIVCPEDLNNMYFPHPGTCSAFCQCSHRTPYEIPCPPGLVFNPQINVCVRSEDYKCNL